MKLLALVLLLSAFSSLTLTEVVKAFDKSKCSEFFIRSPNKRNTVITPTVFKGNQYKKICQRWKRAYRFATLYDTERRIPVYSAYKYTGYQKTVRNEEWKNEPQLENMNRSPEMTAISSNELDNFVNQAVDRDYRDSKTTTGTEYTRGHVFPRQYAADQDQADSTFTFTNVAPQTQHSNGEWGKKVETPMRKVIEDKCKPNKTNPTYIVTGVVPGNKWIPVTRKERNKSKLYDQGVNIPRYYWTAFCCHVSKKEIFSMAYFALQNEPNEKTYEISEMTVNRLNAHLTSLYKKEFKVFGGLYLTSYQPSSFPLIL